MPIQTISATIEKDTLKKLNEVVKKSERKRSWIINKAIQAYLEELEDLEIANSRLGDKRLTSSAIRKTLGLPD